MTDLSHFFRFVVPGAGCCFFAVAVMSFSKVPIYSDVLVWIKLFARSAAKHGGDVTVVAATTLVFFVTGHVLSLGYHQLWTRWPHTDHRKWLKRARKKGLLPCNTSNQVITSFDAAWRTMCVLAHERVKKGVLERIERLSHVAHGMGTTYVGIAFFLSCHFILLGCYAWCKWPWKTPMSVMSEVYVVLGGLILLWLLYKNYRRLTTHTHRMTETTVENTLSNRLPLYQAPKSDSARGIPRAPDFTDVFLAACELCGVFSLALFCWYHRSLFPWPHIVSCGIAWLIMLRISYDPLGKEIRTRLKKKLTPQA